MCIILITIIIIIIIMIVIKIILTRLIIIITINIINIVVIYIYICMCVSISVSIYGQSRKVGKCVPARLVLKPNLPTSVLGSPAPRMVSKRSKPLSAILPLASTVFLSSQRPATPHPGNGHPAPPHARIRGSSVHHRFLRPPPRPPPQNSFLSECILGFSGS